MKFEDEDQNINCAIHFFNQNYFFYSKENLFIEYT